MTLHSTRHFETPFVIFLMGPTAAGKTDLALELVRRLPCEIVSVDSAMIYRGMDIGTAKPGPEVLAAAPHRLIDIRDPSEPYSAAEFAADARREIEAILAAGRIPLLVGGTMLYFRALQKGLADLPSADASLRERLDEEMRSRGLHYLHERLAAVDPQAARRIHPNDPQRIQRALEVYEATGISMTAWLAKGVERKLDYPVVKLAVAPPSRETLHVRIAARFDAMLAQGFLDEVRVLRARGDLHAGLPSIRAVGYRQAWACLAGEMDVEEMRERAIVAARQLAKRQLTWLRAEEQGLWFDALDPATPAALLKNDKLLKLIGAGSTTMC